jgi:DNA-binding response OmpR family regulator
MTCPARRGRTVSASRRGLDTLTLKVGTASAVPIEGEGTVASVLVIEDEPSLRVLLTRLLATAGYSVTTAPNGAEGLRLALNTAYELVLLDLMLPDLSGEEIMRVILASRPDSRIVVLSSDSSITRRIGVLDAGAADFLPKPFANAELLARVRLRMREHGSPKGAADGDGPGSPGTASATVGSRLYASQSVNERLDITERVHLDIRNRELVSLDRRVALSPRECALLTHLVQRRGKVCSRPELLSNVWGLSFDPGTNVLDVYIGRLRAKLSPDVIETVRNVGYRLAAG